MNVQEQYDTMVRDLLFKITDSFDKLEVPDNVSEFYYNHTQDEAAKHLKFTALVGAFFKISSEYGYGQKELTIILNAAFNYMNQNLVPTIVCGIDLNSIMERP